VFLTAALLYRVYQEPHFQDDQPSGFLEQLVSELEFVRPRDRELRPRTGVETLRDSDADYLDTFPIFSPHGLADHEPAFGPLAELLADLSRKSALGTGTSTSPAARLPSVDHNQPRQDAVICSIEAGTAKSTLYFETMELLLGIELLSGCTQPRRLFSDTYKLPPLIPGLPGSRKAIVVSFGRFLLEEVSMPSLTLVAMEVVSSPVESQRGFHDTDVLLHEMYKWSGHPNHSDVRCPATPLSLQCIEYILRRYLGLRFADRAFKHTWENPYQTHCENAHLFFEENVVIEPNLVVSADTPYANPFYDFNGF
jgi:hypothetical protein